MIIENDMSDTAVLVALGQRIARYRLNRNMTPVSYTHLTLPTKVLVCRSRWSPYH